MAKKQAGLAEHQRENSLDMNKRIGRNLRHIRQTRHLSLEEVSRMSQVSKSMLSEIERGTKSPTINILYKICTGIHISFKALLQPQIKTVQVSRGSKPYYKGDFKYQMLFDYDMDSSMELSTIYIEPHMTKEFESHGEGVWEYVFVIEGYFTLTLDEGDFEITKGEGVRFSGNQRHTYSNHSDQGTWIYNMLRYEK